MPRCLPRVPLNELSSFEPHPLRHFTEVSSGKELFTIKVNALYRTPEPAVSMQVVAPIQIMALDGSIATSKQIPVAHDSRQRHPIHPAWRGGR
jgi:hypothetical protein